ncbi:uncharacterized protein BJ171DRAFT_581025 [Polychytrium aggregatum]|uniref:uncharacterized protein n=1 Tax=Polychytrium aggregatum TaxID=110093 RepID=UPI0022FECC95|nr:uncharacterized protein BJ171DRAFT_581025 [Polychytrium aggregatum]KAI9205343.1 hypothetical protein BJ171DRAFT_581025 [Polychytrium aggregatum]
MLAKVARFVEWIGRAGVLANVDVRADSANGYVLVAKKPLHRSELACSIPVDVLVGSHSARKIPTLAAVFEAVFPSPEGLPSTTILDYQDDHLLLMLTLLHAKSHPVRTPWHPYVDLLPEAFANSPLLFDDDDLARLDGSPLAELARGIRQQVQDTYDAVMTPLAEQFGDSFVTAEHASFPAFLWAHMVVESRAFKMRIGAPDGPDPEALSTVLVPLGDLANHSIQGELESCGISTETGCLEIRISSKSRLAEYPADFPLTLTYNRLANWELLMYYGFSLLDNPLERIALSFTSPSEDEDGDYLLNIRKELLLELGEDLGLGLDHEIALGAAGGVPQTLVGSLRLLFATLDELEGFEIGNLADIMAWPISMRNERQILDTLKLLLTTMRDAYPSTLAEDTARLARTSSARERYVLIYLIGQKEILEYGLEWIAVQSSRLNEERPDE